MGRLQWWAVMLLMGAAGTRSRERSQAHCEAAASGGLVEWDSESQVCRPDVCIGSPSGIVHFDRRVVPNPTTEANFMKLRPAGFCNNINPPSNFSRWRPGTVPSTLACSQRLYDTEAARDCLNGKRVVLLGDSTITELAYMVIMTLAREPRPRRRRESLASAPDPQVPNLVAGIMETDRKMAQRETAKRPRSWALQLPDERVSARFDPGGVVRADHGHRGFSCDHPGIRRTSAFVQTGRSNATIEHRWIGSHNPCNGQGGSGLSTLTDPHLGSGFRLTAEDLFLDSPPDAVIIASGAHDLHLGEHVHTKKMGHGKRLHDRRDRRARSPEEYAALVRRTFERLTDGFGVDPTSIVWVSNQGNVVRCNHDAILQRYDAAAEAEARARGATFVDISRTLERHFAQPFFAGSFADDGGLHHGFIRHSQSDEYSMAASAFDAQHVLGAICPAFGLAGGGVAETRRPGAATRATAPGPTSAATSTSRAPASPKSTALAPPPPDKTAPPPSPEQVASLPSPKEAAASPPCFPQLVTCKQS